MNKKEIPLVITPYYAVNLYEKFSTKPLLKDCFFENKNKNSLNRFYVKTIQFILTKSCVNFQFGLVLL